MELSENKVALVERHNKTVYQDGDRIVKVFKKGKPAGDVFNEAMNIARIGETDIKHPHVLEVSQVADGSWALATEYVPGTTLRALLDEAAGDAAKTSELIEKFVDLQVAVQGTKAPDLLTKQNMKFENMISGLQGIDPTVRYDLQMRAARMNLGTAICHGDFNPSNVIVADDGSLYVCDWAHVTRGLPEADAALTYILFKMYHEEQADLYLDLYSVKADVPKQKIMYWVPVVAAVELSRGRNDADDMLSSFVDAANDYE